MACNLITGFHMLPGRWVFLIACAIGEERATLPFQEKRCFSALCHPSACSRSLPGSSAYRVIPAPPPLSGSPRTREGNVPPPVTCAALTRELFSASSSLKAEDEDGLPDTGVLRVGGVKVQP